MKKKKKTGVEKAIEEVECEGCSEWSPERLNCLFSQWCESAARCKSCKNYKRDLSKPTVKSMYGNFDKRNPIKSYCYRKKMERQRRKYGYCDYDTYCFDYWFVFHIAAMIDNVLNNKYGIGMSTEFMREYYVEHSEEYGDAGECAKAQGLDQATAWSIGIVDNKEMLDKYRDDAQHAWEQMLRNMAFWFRESDEELCSRFNPYQYGDEKFWQTEDELRKYREDCLAKAFALLSRWFYSLAI